MAPINSWDLNCFQSIVCPVEITPYPIHCNRLSHGNTTVNYLKTKDKGWILKRMNKCKCGKHMIISNHLICSLNLRIRKLSSHVASSRKKITRFHSTEYTTGSMHMYIWFQKFLHLNKGSIHSLKLTTLWNHHVCIIRIIPFLTKLQWLQSKVLRSRRNLSSRSQQTRRWTEKF